jgi:hypothetical protein
MYVRTVVLRVRARYEVLDAEAIFDVLMFVSCEYNRV